MFWKEHVGQQVRIYLIGSEHWIEGTVESVAEDYVVFAVEIDDKGDKKQKRAFYYKKVSVPLINVLFVLFDVRTIDAKYKGGAK